MASAEFKISKSIINWIAEKEGVTTELLADTVAAKKKEMFLEGIINKSIAEKLIKIGKIPFGFLFLNTPPEIEKPKIPDLRTTTDKIPLSENFYKTLDDVKYKVDWYKEHLADIGGDTKLKYVGKYKLNENLSYKEVANDIIKTIKFDIKSTRKVTKDSYFSYFTTLIENTGILVFKNGVVKNNTKEQLNPLEFRGFALIDDIAPAVFINGSDALSAQLFTLCHEVAHIWIGETGVSDWSVESKTEAFCNKVAAEILMPESFFTTNWENLNNLDNEKEKIMEMSRIYKVSSYAAAVKLAQLNLINNKLIDTIKDEARESYLNRKTSTGGSFYNSAPYKNSPRVTQAILSSAISRKLLLREAGNLLNIKADSVIKLYNKKFKAL